ncbi:tetratricopeptide repeat protein [Ralstonia sp. A12]|uniref:tetratricopeptide repeat protein n=1 Tax=Ralstonia sp. A12 TaxID=1217052 RepID=UPI0006942FC3|nr:tetratricopeptide repeat protein [Ralstonia sp. A12]
MTADSVQSQRLERLQSYLEADPQNERLRADLFEAALAAGNLSLAAQHVDAMLDKDAGSQPWEHRRALLLLAQKQYAEAESVLEGLVIAGANNPVVVYNLAFSLFGQGQFEAARDRLSGLIGQSQEEAQSALALWLRCQHHLGQLNDGLGRFSEVITTQPASTEAIGVASLMAFDAGRLSDAAAWSSQALNVEPDQLEALACQGSLSLGRQDVEAAIATFQHALTLNANDGRSWSGLAFANLLEQRFDQAYAAFGNAVAHMTRHIGTWIGLGWCEFMRRDLSAARRAFSSALALDRNFAESHGSMAVILATEGKRAEAAWEIELALGLDKGCLSARYAQAVLSGEVNDPVAFRKLAVRVLAQHPGPVKGQSLADVVLRNPHS